MYRVDFFITLNTLPNARMSLRIFMFAFIFIHSDYFLI